MKKIIGTFFLLIILRQIVWAQVVPYTVDANTVLLDHFDSSTSASILANSWNSGACGTPKPSATPSYSYGTGPNGLNQALTLNAPAGQPFGSSTYLQYPGGQLLSQANGTFELWVYLTSYGVTGFHLVDQGPYYGSCAGWTFWLYVDSTGQLGAGAWAAFSLTSGSVKVPLNTWTHLATTWGSAGAKLYINGVLVGSDANTGMPAAGGSVLISLCTPAGAAGSIDELRISNVQRTTFNVLAAPPTITSFSPTSGPIGTAVTVIGTSFSSTPSNNIVFFGATKATVTSASTTQLTVTVPASATYQPITVTVGGLTGYSSQPFIVTFPTVASITSGSFAAKVDFATGTYPFGLAIGDVDGDGKPDLVICNCNDMSGTTVSVFRNTSSFGSITSGSFAAKVDFTTGVSPRGLAIGDIDGDGKPDLVVGNYVSSTVSVLRNTSSSGSITSGSFAAKVDFATGTMPDYIAIGDIDGDGKPDLVTANYYSNTISVLRNTSSSDSISFAAKVDFATGTNPFAVAVGDIDGDGKPDLVVVNHGNNTVSVLRNTSSSDSITSGSFAAKVDFATGTTPYSVAIGDIDGDGKLDLIVSNSSSNTVSVFRNTGSSGSITSGSFAARVDFATGANPIYTAIGDIDGDGKPDLVVGNFASNTVSLLRNTISGRNALIGIWDKVSGPGDPISYNFLTDSTVVVVQNQTTSDTANYTTFPISSSSLRGIDLGQGGVVGWRGIYQISSDSSVLQIEGYWYTGLPPVSTPTSFTSPTTYAKVDAIHNTQIPNGGFEDWTIQSGIEIPLGPWTTGNLLDKPVGVTYNPVTKSSDHYPLNVGSYSIRMENNISFISEPGGAFPYWPCAYGYSTTAFYPGYTGPVFPITGHPTSLCGYYKFIPQNNDTMTISLGLYQNGVLVAHAVFTGTAIVSDWTSFNIPISTYITADSAQIGLSAFYAKLGISPTGPYGNSILYVDNLSFDNLITSVLLSSSEIPSKFTLAQNYPNPFNPTTTISFSLPTQSFVSLKVFDALGRKVATLVSNELQAGNYSRQWNAANMSSGVYFYRMQAGSFVQTKKLVVVK